MNRIRSEGSDAIWALARLAKQAREARGASFQHAWASMAHEHWPEDDHQETGYEPRHWQRRLQRSVDELDAQLPDFDYDGSDTMGDDPSDHAIGSEFEVMAPIPILRGFVVPVREVPILLKISARMLAFIDISGERDMLDRHMDQGIHYHYALADGTHTTTMICWDTRWTPGLSQKSASNIRPIFHELHGLGAKRKQARPELWGDSKRESIRKACAPDLDKWRDINAFRCASNKASPVWPTVSVLTPRPPSPSAAGKKSGRR